ncbi:ABC transporter family protein [Acinetobacter calcoaceticus]|uniref:ABC transporter family protein n=1 Tax=Acinetobacter calcoaceticus TaxID=471 RepID=A0A4R1Y0E8_ACICA|nr:ABC transporter family protein [Acinetobacter calcoaceticus]
MRFEVIRSDEWFKDSGKNIAYLKVDNWNDYSFRTQFAVKLFDQDGVSHDLGDVKIGYKGQTEGIENASHLKMKRNFSNLSDSFFSLSSDIEYYKKLSKVPLSTRSAYLTGINDLVKHPELITKIENEKVFSTSLLRDVYLTAIRGKLKNVLDGNNESTPFEFSFIRNETENMGALSLDFDVQIDTKPSTNIHAIIGRNGVGKTTVLNNIISAIRNTEDNQEYRIEPYDYRYPSMNKDYFSSLISISFSAFDPFTPPKEQPDPSKGTCYFYLGLKKADNDEKLLGFKELRLECIRSLMNCFTQKDKAERWLKAIQKLSSDINFAAMQLSDLHKVYGKLSTQYLQDKTDTISYKERRHKMLEEYQIYVLKTLERMSSGHSIVFMTITRLVEKVDERSLVLLDEPESHLHPPLLSAFVRALSDLLINRNAIAIIATHSPVVLQEIPKSCVWKLFRSGKSITADRPKIETFGESVSDLTTEIFGLEVIHSGFHNILQEAVNSGKDYKSIIRDFNNQIGFEGRALLQIMIADRGE